MIIIFMSEIYINLILLRIGFVRPEFGHSDEFLSMWNSSIDFDKIEIRILLFINRHFV